MGSMGYTVGRAGIVSTTNDRYNKECFTKHKGNLATIRELSEALQVKGNTVHNKISLAKSKLIPTPVVICVNGHNHNHYYLKREFISWFKCISN